MRSHGLAFLRRQGRVVVNDVEQRLVDLADVMEEGDALDVPEGALAQVGGVGEDERITSDAADVRAGFSVVGVDRAQQGFEHGGGETLGREAALPLANEQGAGCCSRREPEIAKHGAEVGKKTGHPLG